MRAKRDIFMLQIEWSDQNLGKKHWCRKLVFFSKILRYNLWQHLCSWMSSGFLSCRIWAFPHGIVKFCLRTSDKSIMLALREMTFFEMVGDTSGFAWFVLTWQLVSFQLSGSSEIRWPKFNPNLLWFVWPSRILRVALSLSMNEISAVPGVYDKSTDD